MTTTKTAMDLLAAILRAEDLRSTDVIERSHEIVEAAIDQGVAALVASTPSAPALAAAPAEYLDGYVRSQGLVTGVRDEEVRRVVSVLRDGGVVPLVIKGAHLARTVYARPELRPRSDTDLLISPAERERVGELFCRAGYAPLAHVQGAVILGQFHFARRDSLRVDHLFDVHWRVAAPLVFGAPLLTAESLCSRSHAIASLAPARGPSPPDALVIACIHLVAHHRGDPLLLWLLDLHLLARSLSAAARESFVDAAVAARITRVCAYALNQAAHRFPDPSLFEMAEQLETRGAGQRELSARLLTARRRVSGVWLDLMAAGSWRTRAQLIREHVFPSADYMRGRGATGEPLPAAYATRLIRGLRKWSRQ